MNIGFIGAGNMAEAILSGLITTGIDCNNIFISNHNKNKSDLNPSTSL